VEVQSLENAMEMRGWIVFARSSRRESTMRSMHHQNSSDGAASRDGRPVLRHSSRRSLRDVMQ
jgi:hypothetical protein